VRSINFEWLSFVPASSSHPPYQCDACRQVAWRNISGVCPSLGCDGTLAVLVPDNDNHYLRLYSDLKPLWLSVEEHTAQLATDTAARRQQQFIDGDVNVLSCSTTFELGVDVGEVQACCFEMCLRRPRTMSSALVGPDGGRASLHWSSPSPREEAMTVTI